MQVVLAMFRADGERRSFSVVRDMTVIGRREDCDLRIPLGEVSRKHCRLIKDGDAVKVEDLGSSNGTYHNGVRVQEAYLSPGDTVQVGPVTFVVQIDGVPADEDLRPGQAPALAADGTEPEVTELMVLEEPTEANVASDVNPPEAAYARAPAPPQPAAADDAEFDFTLEESHAAEESATEDIVDFELDDSPAEPSHPDAKE